MALFDLIVRFIIALIFGAVSMLFLSFALLIGRKLVDTKKSAIASLIFALLLFSFSFFTNLIFSIITAIAMLIVIKYIYSYSWKESLGIWGVWMLIWIVLFTIIASIIYIASPLTSPI